MTYMYIEYMYPGSTNSCDIDKYRTYLFYQIRASKIGQTEKIPQKHDEDPICERFLG